MRQWITAAAGMAVFILGISAFGDPDKPDPKNAAAVAQVGEFAIDLLPRLQSQNVISSPYLISSAFALLRTGARGQTRQQIDNVFHFPKDYEFPLLDEAKPRDEKKPDANAPLLATSSTLFLDKQVELDPDFLAAAEKKFRTAVTSVDLKNPQAAVKTLNKSVALATHDKITEAITPQLLEGAASHAFLLTQTLYFKGTWKTAFDPKGTRPADFFTPGLPPQKVPMMTLKNGDFAYGHFDGVQVVKVPYADKRYALLILLPDDRKGFAAQAKRPDLDHLQKMLTAMQETWVDLYLPRFSIVDSHSLTGTLAAMGMPDAFGDKADFSAMKKTVPGIYLTFVCEQVAFAVDETGTEAAAAVTTGGGLFSSSAPPPPPPVPIVFRVDHPCIMVLLDNVTGMPLFVAGLRSPPAVLK